VYCNRVSHSREIIAFRHHAKIIIAQSQDRVFRALVTTIALRLPFSARPRRDVAAARVESLLDQETGSRRGRDADRIFRQARQQRQSGLGPFAAGFRNREIAHTHSDSLSSLYCGPALTSVLEASFLPGSRTPGVAQSSPTRIVAPTYALALIRSAATPCLSPHRIRIRLVAQISRELWLRNDPPVLVIPCATHRTRQGSSTRRQVFVQPSMCLAHLDIGWEVLSNLSPSPPGHRPVVFQAARQRHVGIAPPVRRTAPLISSLRLVLRCIHRAAQKMPSRLTPTEQSQRAASARLDGPTHRRPWSDSTPTVRPSTHNPSQAGAWQRAQHGYESGHPTVGERAMMPHEPVALPPRAWITPMQGDARSRASYVVLPSRRRHLRAAHTLRGFGLVVPDRLKDCEHLPEAISPTGRPPMAREHVCFHRGPPLRRGAWHSTGCDA